MTKKQSVQAILELIKSPNKQSVDDYVKEGSTVTKSFFKLVCTEFGYDNTLDKVALAKEIFKRNNAFWDPTIHEAPGSTVTAKALEKIVHFVKSNKTEQITNLTPPAVWTTEEKGPGWVYIVHNPAWPEWIKIGKTISIPNRLSAYNVSAPAVQYRFQLKAQFPTQQGLVFEEPLFAEQTIHKILRTDSTINPIGATPEWYKMSIQEAILRVENILEAHSFPTVSNP